MVFEREFTLMVQAKHLPRYYQARVNEALGAEDWELGLEISSKALAIIVTEPFDPDAVDELYERFQEVKDKIDGSASFDLNSVIVSLKHIADAERKQL